MAETFLMPRQNTHFIKVEVITPLALEHAEIQKMPEHQWAGSSYYEKFSTSYENDLNSMTKRFGHQK